MEEEKKIINEENKPKEELIPVKNNNGLIIALVVIIVILAALIAYLLFFNKPKEETNDNNETQQTETENNNEEKEEPQETEEETGKYDLVVYKYKDGGYLSTESKKTSELTEAFKIKVNSKNAKVLATDYINQYLLLYSDDGLYTYNSKTKKKEKIELANTYSEYGLHISEDENKIIGIRYLDKNKNFGYYSITKNTKLFDGKYKVEELWNAAPINDHYLSLYSDKMLYLLSLDSESAKLSYKDETDMGVYTFSSFGTNGKYIFALTTSFDTTSYERFYDSKYNLIYQAPDNGNVWEENLFFKNDYLYFVYKGVVYKYNLDGELVSTNSKYTDIKFIDNGYIVYVKDNNLVVENIEDNTESKVLVKWDSKWNVDTFDSRYYTRDNLDRMSEKNKKEGLYVVVEYGYDDDGNNVKDSKGYYGMEYCYTPDKQVVTYPIKEAIGGRAKPVLYLYPEKETNVTVSFAHPEYLTTTYPKYINSWSVTAKPNGDLRDSNGKYYYALYWDETRYSEVNFKEGFYVEASDAINFLEEKLSIIGLNDKERNEFIMYWLPIMEKNGKNLVYFELTEERESNNKLVINPKPDSLLRVSIHIKKVNTKVNIKEQKLTTFNRYGFTAVEWGGMTY